MVTWRDEQCRDGWREGRTDAGGKDGRREDWVDGGRNGVVTEGRGIKDGLKGGREE